MRMDLAPKPLQACAKEYSPGSVCSMGALRGMVSSRPRRKLKAGDLMKLKKLAEELQEFQDTVKGIIRVG